MNILAQSAPALAHGAAASDVASSPLLDRRPLTLRAEDDAAHAVSALLVNNGWGAAVLDTDSRYLGMCTLRSLADLALLVSVDSTPHAPAFDYHHEDIGALAARFAAKVDTPVTRALDRGVPMVRGTQSLPQVLALLIRRAPILAVLDERDESLLGVVTLERALRLLHVRSGIAAHRPA
jgi:hypothetical protein